MNADAPNPARMSQAEERLDKAVAELEKTVAERIENAVQKNVEQLEAIEAKRAELEKVNQAVSERLDKTIGRLKTVLGS